MNYKKLLRDIIVAVLSAILTFLTCTSCAGGIVIGHRNRQYQEVHGSASADSSTVSPTITIR